VKNVSHLGEASTTSCTLINISYIAQHFSMGNHKISDDLKEASLHMKARLCSDKEVLAIAGFLRSTLK
jgi:hypothetical protein